MLYRPRPFLFANNTRRICDEPTVGQNWPMRDTERLKLRYGPYRTPRFRYGSVKRCALQGDVKITGLGSERIPWPMGSKPGRGGRCRASSRPSVEAAHDVRQLTWPDPAPSLRHGRRRGKAGALAQYHLMPGHTFLTANMQSRREHCSSTERPTALR